MSELKPCPFCGGNAIVDSVIDGRHHGVDTWATKVCCAKCYVTTQRYLGDCKYLGKGKNWPELLYESCKEAAIAAWNNRQGKTE